MRANDRLAFERRALLVEAAYTKWVTGGSLTDEELDLLLDRFKALINVMKPLHLVFEVPLKLAIFQRSRLKGIRRARGIIRRSQLTRPAQGRV